MSFFYFFIFYFKLSLYNPLILSYAMTKSSDERNYIDDSEWDQLTDTYRPSNYYSSCLDMPEDYRD